MAPTERMLELRFPSRPDRLKVVRAAVRCAAQCRGAGDEDTDRMVLAVNEACMNVIQHAYGDARIGDVIVEILAGPAELVFRVLDFAEPVDPERCKGRDLDDLRPGGLGVHFIREVMDSAGFVQAPDGVGNVFEMTKKMMGPRLVP